MSFTGQQIQRVWEKGQPVKGFDPARWRKDACTAWMDRLQYGNRNSIYGWEIDHINPDGGDHIGNLQPLQWENNAAKSDDNLKCVVRSSGNINVHV